jgi:cob(I)alamin adenosyltransferase
MSYDVDGNHAAIVLGAEEFVPALVEACRSVSRRIERRRAA